MELGRPDRAARLDALAAEYALGTLSARARMRLATMARGDPVIATSLRAWEYRLAALAEAVPAVTPPPRVWDGVRQRLGFEPTTESAGSAADVMESWWLRLSVWRGLALAGFALAFTFAALLASLPGREQGGTLIVVLTGADARPALVASAERNSRMLLIKAVAPLSVAPGRSLELWALPPGHPPQSLGLLGTGGLTRVALPASAGAILANVPALAVSLEPAGGSPTGQPTGPVLYSGAVQRLF